MKPPMLDLPGAVEAFRVLRDARIPHAIATASYRPLIDACAATGKRLRKLPIRLTNLA